MQKLKLSDKKLEAINVLLKEKGIENRTLSEKIPCAAVSEFRMDGTRRQTAAAVQQQGSHAVRCGNFARGRALRDFQGHAGLLARARGLHWRTALGPAELCHLRRRPPGSSFTASFQRLS